MNYFQVKLKWIKTLYLSLAVTFFIFIVIDSFPDIKLVLGHLREFSLALGVTCLLFAILNYWLRSLRWLCYVRLKEKKASIKRHTLIYFSGFAFSASPAKSGELIRGAYLYILGVPFSYTFICFVSERFLDIVVVLFLASFFIITHFDSIFGYLPFLLISALFFVSPALKYLAGFVAKKEWRKYLERLSGLWHKRVLLKSLALTMLAWPLQGIILFFTLQHFNMDVSITMAVSIYSLSLLIGAASLLPGGFGATELSMVWLLNQVGVSNELAIMASLTTRMLTFWPAMIIGLVSAALLKLTRYQNFKTVLPFSDESTN